MQDYIGKQIDQYKIVSLEGVGTFSVVYKAYDTRLERDVAFKLIHKESFPQDQHERLLKLFEQEAKAQEDFSHQYIVPTYDYGEIEGSPYIVMSYFPSGTLKGRIGLPTDYQDAINWMIPILVALSYAHKRGVIHQDIKPSNILVDEEGQLLLSDFSIASVIKSVQGSLAETSMGVGTPEYMAPEQFNGQANEASDQYAIGVVLYELLTGQKPYTAPTPQAVQMNKMLRPLVSPSILCPEVPAELDRILIKVLAKEPDQRYKDMAKFQKELVQLTTKWTPGLIASTDENLDLHRPPEEIAVSEPKLEVESDKELAPIRVGIQKPLSSPPKRTKQKSAEQVRTTLTAYGLYAIMLGIFIAISLFFINALNIGKGSRLAFVIEPFRAVFGAKPTQSTGILVDSIEPITQTLSPSSTPEFTTAPTHTSTITPTATPTEIVLKAQVIVENALLRSGPDFSHPIISERLAQYLNLIVISKSPSELWFLVKTEDGLSGWLFTDWIELDVPIDLIPIEQFIPTPPIINTATTPPIEYPDPPESEATEKPPEPPPQYP